MTTTLAARVTECLEIARLTGLSLGTVCREAGIGVNELNGVLGGRPDILAEYRRLQHAAGRSDALAQPPTPGEHIARRREASQAAVRAAQAMGGAVLPNGAQHNTAVRCVVASCPNARGGNRDHCPAHRAQITAFWRGLAADLRAGRIG